MTINFEKLLKDIVVPIVLVPENIEIVQNLNEKTINIDLFVDKNDLGRVIGRGGKTIQAIRTLVYTVAAKDNLHVNLEVKSK